jgi:Clp amino terminal domain, pathogenicity island component
MVQFTKAAGIVPHLGREEAESRHQYYLGSEHLLLGLLVQGENLAARVLRAHGLDLDDVRAGIDQLVAEGVLPGPQPSDAELLATLGIDLDAVLARVKEGFGWDAYYYAAQRVRLRPIQPFPRAPGGGTPLICWRVFRFAAEEAAARGEDATPAQWLLALLRDAEDPVEAGLQPMDRRRRAMAGLPNRGPSPVRLLVESRGLTLDQLRTAVLEELGQDR